MKKLLLCTLAALLMVPSAYADKKDKNKKGVPTPPHVVQPAIVNEGLFTVSKTKTDWFLEIPDSLLGRVIQTVTRYTSTPVGANVYGGEMVNTQTIYFQKNDDKIFLRSLILGAKTEGKNEIEKAVKISSEDPIVASFKIESTANGRDRINVTRLFTDDTQIFAMSSSRKKSLNIGSVLSDRSFIKSIHSFPINTEVQTIKTYSYFASERSPLLFPSTSTPLMSGEETGCVTFSFNTSLGLLQKETMKHRLADPRVRYFTDRYTYYSHTPQPVDEKEFITRWR